MALTRKLLKGMGLTEEQIDSIIDAHTDSLEGLQSKVKSLEAEAAEAKDLKKQLEDLKGGKDWKAEHDKVKKELDDYRAEQQGKELSAKKRAAYKALLEKEKIDPKRIDTVLKADRDKIEALELDGDTVKDADKLTEAIKADWSDFVTTTVKRGVNNAKPPKSEGGSAMTKEEIMAIKDTAQRQAAIAEHHELFGI